MSKVLSLVLVLVLISFSSFAAEKEWTFMVFLNGDNNLEGAGIKDVNEMETIGSNEKANIVVQFDRCEGYDSTNGNWEGTKRYYIVKDNDFKTIKSPVVQDMGEVDMGSGDELVKFVKWAKEKYPAKHYCLVLWNHGMGWRDGVKPTSSLIKGISYDDESGNHIDTPALGKAMKNIYSVLGKKLDIIAFDACLMQMAEVQYEVSPYADYMIASEETEPGDGWPYDQVCPLFVGGKSARECAARVVDEYIDFYTGQSVTQAAMDLKYAGALKDVVSDFADAMNANLSAVKSQIASARSASQEYAVTDYVDLYHFASLVASKVSNTAVKSAANKVCDFIKNSGLVVNSKYVGTSMKNSHGVALWIPESTSGSSSWWSQPLPFTSSNRDAYSKVKFAIYGTWDNFLAAYHAKSEVADEMLREITAAVDTDANTEEEIIARADYVSSLVSSFADMVNASEDAMDTFKNAENVNEEVISLIESAL